MMMQPMMMQQSMMMQVKEASAAVGSPSCRYLNDVQIGIDGPSFYSTKETRSQANFDPNKPDTWTLDGFFKWMNVESVQLHWGQAFQLAGIISDVYKERRVFERKTGDEKQFVAQQTLTELRVKRVQQWNLEDMRKAITHLGVHGAYVAGKTLYEKQNHKITLQQDPSIRIPMAVNDWEFGLIEPSPENVCNGLQNIAPNLYVNYTEFWKNMKEKWYTMDEKGALEILKPFIESLRQDTGGLFKMDESWRHDEVGNKMCEFGLVRLRYKDSGAISGLKIRSTSEELDLRNFRELITGLKKLYFPGWTLFQPNGAFSNQMRDGLAFAWTGSLTSGELQEQLFGSVHAHDANGPGMYFWGKTDAEWGIHMLIKQKDGTFNVMKGMELDEVALQTCRRQLNNHKVEYVVEGFQIDSLSLVWEAISGGYHLQISDGGQGMITAVIEVHALLKWLGKSLQKIELRESFSKAHELVLKVDGAEEKLHQAFPGTGAVPEPSFVGKRMHFWGKTEEGEEQRSNFGPHMLRQLPNGRFEVTELIDPGNVCDQVNIGGQAKQSKNPFKRSLAIADLRKVKDANTGEFFLRMSDLRKHLGAGDDRVITAAIDSQAFVKWLGLPNLEVTAESHESIWFQLEARRNEWNERLKSQQRAKEKQEFTFGR
jgi:hypothetical protein